MTKPKYKLRPPLKKFKRNLKKLIDKFKFTDQYIQSEIVKLINDPDIGITISLYPKFLKLRVRIPGVSGKKTGLRLIFYKDTLNHLLIPALCYYKSDKQDVTKQELLDIEKEILDLIKDNAISYSTM